MFMCTARSKIIEDDEQLHNKDHPVESLPQGVFRNLELNLYIAIVRRGQRLAVLQPHQWRSGVRVLDLLLLGHRVPAADVGISRQADVVNMHRARPLLIYASVSL